MKTPFGRWDIGDGPSEGVSLEGLENRRYNGTKFALLYDRRWQWIATFRDIQPIPRNITATDAGYVPKSKSLLIKHRKEALSAARSYAEWYLPSVYRPDGILRFGHLTMTNHGRFTKVHLLFDVLSKIAKEPKMPISDVERANWVAEGVNRWASSLPLTWDIIFDEIAWSCGNSPGLAAKIRADFEDKRLISLLKSSGYQYPEKWLEETGS